MARIDRLAELLTRGVARNTSRRSLLTWLGARPSTARTPAPCPDRPLPEAPVAPAQDEEFVLSHSDNVQATGFVEHLKLPHYVDFQAELGLVRKLRAERSQEPSGQSVDDRREAAE